MTPTRFTVVTTCLDRGQFIERTVCSVIDQAHPASQYIVVDRGSTDDTLDILGIYADDLTLLKLSGASHAEALNAALAKATGDVVVFADDLLLPGALSTIEQKLNTNRGIEWLVGEAIEFDDDDSELNVITPQPPKNLGEYLMHDGGLLPISGTCIRRSLLESVEGFDEALLHAHGYDCWARLMSRGHRARVLETPICGQRETQAVAASDALKQGLEFIFIARRYASHLSLREQAALWRNCDERQRIYALAEAELSGTDASRTLWARLRSHPWWIMDQSIRQTLMHGVAHPAPAALTRSAA